MRFLKRSSVYLKKAFYDGDDLARFFHKGPVSRAFDNAKSRVLYFAFDYSRVGNGSGSIVFCTLI